MLQRLAQLGKKPNRKETTHTTMDFRAFRPQQCLQTRLGSKSPEIRFCLLSLLLRQPLVTTPRPTWQETQSKGNYTYNTGFPGSSTPTRPTDTVGVEKPRNPLLSFEPSLERASCYNASRNPIERKLHIQHWISGLFDSNNAYRHGWGRKASKSPPVF